MKRLIDQTNELRLTRIKSTLEYNRKLMEQPIRINELSYFLSLSEEKYQSLIQSVEVENLKALETAIATLRKTKCYGGNKFPVNFECPTAQEMLNMPKNIAIKV